jgi:prophage DNA circulation protein
MDGIPSVYWMILISIFTGFICFVLYQLAMLFKESRNAVKETKKILIDAQETLKVLNGIVNDVNEVVSTVKGTVYQVNSVVLVPLRKISAIMGIASGFIEGVTSKKSKR